MSVLNTLLNELPAELDKQPGYLPYDLAKGLAIELERMDSEYEKFRNLFDLEKWKGDDLTRYVYQISGVIRHEAVKATGQVTVTGNGTLKTTDIFQTKSGIKFKPISDTIVQGSSLVNVVAETGGSSGNVEANTITQIPITIQGIQSVTNILGTSGGYESESDIQLISRCYQKLQTPSTSGNKHQYKLWALEVPGTGDALVISRWAGKGTVKVVLVDSNGQPAPEQVVNAVQLYIDPNRNGDGSGVAPIGAVCTVVAADTKALEIAVKVKCAQNYTEGVVRTNILNGLNKYLSSIIFKQNYISYSMSSNSIATAAGVADFSDYKINGAMANVPLIDTEVGVIISLTIEVMQ